MAASHIYKVMFVNQGKVYEIYFSVDHTRSYGDWLASQQTDEDRL